MTAHPARPAHPFIDPAAMRDELADLDALTADVFGPDVPLRDRVATLVADWSDGTYLHEPPTPAESVAEVDAGVADAEIRCRARRGLT